MMENTNVKELNEPQKVKTWLKRIGIAGFIFFLVKGLVWIALFLGLGNLI